MRTHKSSGFAILELVLVVAVLAAAGLAAWYVYQRQLSVTPNGSLSTTTADAKIPSAPQVNTSTDLNTALNTVDQADPASDNSDLAQLDTQSSGF